MSKAALRSNNNNAQTSLESIDLTIKVGQLAVRRELQQLCRSLCQLGLHDNAIKNLDCSLAVSDRVSEPGYFADDIVFSVSATEKT